MQRIMTPTAVADLFGSGKNGFADSNPALGVLPTDLNATWFNGIQEEIAYIIEIAGLTLDGDDLTQLKQALDLLYSGDGGSGGGIPFAEALNYSETYTAVYNPTVTALVDGMTVAFRAPAASGVTGALFTCDGFGPWDIVLPTGDPLPAGAIAGGGKFVAIVNYNAANFQWILTNPWVTA